MHRLKLLPLITITVLFGAACGTEVLAGGHRDGEVRGVATSSSGGSPSNAEIGPRAALAANVGAPTGAVEFTASLLLVSDENVQYLVTDGVANVHLGLATTDRIEFARSEIPVGHYTEAIVIFTRVRADVTGGLIVNGLPFVGEIAVAASADDPATVQVPISMDVSETGSSTILLDLRATAWLTAAEVAGTHIPQAVFENAIQIIVADE